jgi:hypothetical protein
MGIRAGEKDINPSPAESASNSVCEPGAGAAQHRAVGFPAFIWRIPGVDSTNRVYLSGCGRTCQGNSFGVCRGSLMVDGTLPGCVRPRAQQVPRACRGARFHQRTGTVPKGAGCSNWSVIG